jgi:hypothetical protein
MNDRQAEEIIRQLQRLNNHLLGIGSALVALLLCAAALVFILWKMAGMRL